MVVFLFAHTWNALPSHDDASAKEWRFSLKCAKLLRYPSQSVWVRRLLLLSSLHTKAPEQVCRRRHRLRCVIGHLEIFPQEQANNNNDNHHQPSSPKPPRRRSSPGIPDRNEYIVGFRVKTRRLMDEFKALTRGCGIAILMPLDSLNHILDESVIERHEFGGPWFSPRALKVGGGLAYLALVIIEARSWGTTSFSPDTSRVTTLPWLRMWNPG